MTYGEDYGCRHCKGLSEVKVLKQTEKATEPMIKFCPFCGMANHYPVEQHNDYSEE